MLGAEEPPTVSDPWAVRPTILAPQGTAFTAYLRMVGASGNSPSGVAALAPHGTAHGLGSVGGPAVRPPACRTARGDRDRRAPQLVRPTRTVPRARSFRV